MEEEKKGEEKSFDFREITRVQVRSMDVKNGGGGGKKATKPPPIWSNSITHPLIMWGEESIARAAGGMRRPAKESLSAPTGVN
jgi:hypothetical protein